MKKLMNLKLDGKKVVLGGPSTIVLSIKKVVSKLHKGEYLTTEGLAERLKTSTPALQALVNRNKELFEDHRQTITTPDAAKLMVYGSAASIAALRKELEA